MEGLELIEPNDLYNLLQQGTNFSCLSDTNYLLLIDARKKNDYNESHIVTSKSAPKSDNDLFMIPYEAELSANKISSCMTVTQRQYQLHHTLLQSTVQNCFGTWEVGML